MTEISVHLESMRDSAEKIRRSASNMHASASAVRAMYVTLPVDVQNAVITEVGFTPNLDSMHWLDMLIEFSRKLERAAIEIENAALAEPEIDIEPKPPAYTGMTLGDMLPRILGNSDEDIFKPVPIVETFALGDYVAAFNRPVYDQMVTSKANLHNQMEQLEHLYSLREEKVSDLQALQNRMVAAGTTNYQSIPLYQTMQSDINRIDQDIRTTENNIQAIRTYIGDLQDRLSRVTPGDGANLDLIRELENGVTQEGIRQNTYGCVNYIVNKMAIPPGIPNDAYQWNDNAARLAEYGIRTGDIPLPGSVIVFEREHSWADSVHGHLMYVERVENAEVWITDNYNPDEPVRLSDITTEISGENVTYLYFPWHTRVF
jgi:hypothetical protein